jgi:hypothetical protein
LIAGKFFNNRERKQIKKIAFVARFGINKAIVKWGKKQASVS